MSQNNSFLTLCKSILKIVTSLLSFAPFILFGLLYMQVHTNPGMPQKYMHYFQLICYVITARIVLLIVSVVIKAIYNNLGFDIHDTEDA